MSVVNRPRLERILQRVFDENEFLSPFGIRSLSRYHKDNPYKLALDGATFSVGYEPGRVESWHIRRKFQLAWPCMVPDEFLD